MTTSSSAGELQDARRVANQHRGAITWTRLPLFWLATALVLSIAGALEVGFRLGHVVHVGERQTDTVAAPILGLVALLLAFSFSMANERHALRRAAAIHEANAIGTFWLRTSLLPDPLKVEARALLRSYVDTHLEHRRAGTHEDWVATIEREVSRAHSQLWRLVMLDARENPEASRVRLLVPALNSLIGDTSTVLSAKQNQVPHAIFGYLIAAALVAATLVGYRPLADERHVVLWSAFVIVVSGALMLLVDMDRPREGLIQTDLTPYLRLRDSMNEELP